jgi:hypothetical protein
MKCNICGKENKKEVCDKCYEELKNIQKEEYDYIVRNSVYHKD